MAVNELIPYMYICKIMQPFPKDITDGRERDSGHFFTQCVACLKKKEILMPPYLPIIEAGTLVRVTADITVAHLDFPVY